MNTTTGRLAASTLLLGVALTATYPLYTETYRSMAFQTMPRDDYAPYLLALTGDGPAFADSPRVYRILSVAVAVPFYYALPAYRFTKLPEIDVDYLRATHALAFTSWLALAGLAVLVYRITRDRFRASSMAAGVAFFAAPLYAQYTGMPGVDPVALLLIAAAYYALAAPAAFAPLLIASAAFNEKIVIIFTLLMAGRVLASPRDAVRRLPIQIAACAVALVGYFTMRLMLKFPGNESQVQPLTYFSDTMNFLTMTFSFKGAIQNVFPTALVFAAYAFVLSRRDLNSTVYWSRTDILVPLGLLGAGTAINVEYTLGRLVAHALPLVLPAAAAAIERAAATRSVPNEPVYEPAYEADERRRSSP